MGKMSVNTNSNSPGHGQDPLQAAVQAGLRHFAGPTGTGIGGCDWHEALKATGASGEGDGTGGGSSGVLEAGGQLAATGVTAGGGSHTDANFAARMANQAMQASMPKGR